MDAKRAPQDKLACVSKCSQHIFEALSTSNNEPANADDFLTSLVYVVLKANPPRLHSNMQYMIRFGLPHSLMAGESGYYFTNLVSCVWKRSSFIHRRVGEITQACRCPLLQSCAVAFIEKLDGPALNLSPEQFDGYMRGQRAPAALKRQQKANGTQKLLEELQGRQEKLHQGVDALNMQLQKWVQVVNSQLDKATSQFDKVQKEITAQTEASEVVTSSAEDGSQQKEEEQ